MIRAVTVTNYLGESKRFELAFPEKSGFAVQSISGLGPSKADIRQPDFQTGCRDFSCILAKKSLFLSDLTHKPQTMTLNEYQQHALETAIYPDDRRIIYPTLGLTGEAGEVADKVKKVIRDAHEEFTPEKKLEIVKEIGDVMWYCATLARDLGYELDDVARS